MPQAASDTRASERLDQRKRGEIQAFFWIVVSVLLTLSLLSYTPTDISWLVSAPNSPAHNYAGVAGAYTAFALRLLFGSAAFLLIPLLLTWALSRWAGRKGQHLSFKVFSTVIFMSSSCALASILFGRDSVGRFESGGMLGYFGAQWLDLFVGPAGAFVALSLLILSILLASELLLLQMAVDLFSRLRDRYLKNAETERAAATVKAGVPAVKRSALQELIQKERGPAKVVKAEARSGAQIVPVPAAPTAPPQPPKIKLNRENETALEPKSSAGKDAVKEPSKDAVREMTKPPVTPKTDTPQPAKAAAAKADELKPKAADAAPLPVEEDLPAYALPAMDLLQAPPPLDQGKMRDTLQESSKVLEDTLRDFGIDAKVVEVEQGPTITRYELQPAAGVKVQKITSLENDIALVMRAASVRILAPIPGKSRVGIEVPNSAAATVYIREVLASPEFQNERSKVAIAIGKDTAGSPLVCNLADLPHLLIAGATNTGKSVCINSIITSILYRATPEEVKFLMIDPKMVELHFYNDLPHLICPVVTDKTKAPNALGWLLNEMERRYKVLSKVGARNILAFNEKVENKQIDPRFVKITEDNEDEPVIVRKLPYIVLVIDELADLMMTSAQEVETAITRLAQLARAVGIHMILATQRPSVDVITGVIKANFPARLAFQVASKVDSRTILDENGADKLLGRGDLLLMDPRRSKLVRAQGAWVQDAEVERITDFIKKQRKPAYADVVSAGVEKKAGFATFERDQVYEEAKRVVLETGQASVSMVQRRLGVGYTRAARLIDMMEEDGVVGPYRGAKPREILVERPEAQPGGSEETPA
ncbi:MAG: hypothetical protein MOGMAGMI_01064 [Candidatus Omnitrophica bacterium]|nr:hypothetical protein [Candidatus Omnitrophota bacterium]